jgi:DUF1009 family protein
MQRKLGIIAGGGPLPKYLAEHCQFNGREYFVIALVGNADERVLHALPIKWVRLGAAGKIIQSLKEQNVEEIVMVGAVRRPSIMTLFPDWRAVRLIFRIGSILLGGDNSLLTAIAEELERYGFKVTGVDELLSELLAPDGPFGKIRPDNQDLKFIQSGIQQAQIFCKQDTGQAIVIQNDVIIGTENRNGTDELIKRCRNTVSDHGKPILIKIKKPGQDRRVDLPTIGVRTVQLAAECGFSGIVVETGQTLVVDRVKVTKMADQSGLFVIGTKLNNEQ